jgi:phosphoribosylamine--glycine ligase
MTDDQRLDVLVVGGGGREHALVRGLARSARMGRLFCAPGNAGIAADAQIVALSGEDVPGIVAFAEKEGIDLVVVGPEAPLVAGLGDSLRQRGFAVFGPNADGALLEGSKAFAKEVMNAAGVPTAGAAAFTSYEDAKAYLDAQGAPVVIKADGLAAGKGVIVALTQSEAEAGLADCFLERRFGDAAGTVLIEEYLVGEELSLLSIVSGLEILPLAPAQDYKRALDGDAGPNTGGMGSYSPVPSIDEALYAELVERVVRPTVKEIHRRGIDFRGVLYSGLMLTAEGPKVLEFNCRFGDPETQAIIPRMRSDLLELLWAAARAEALPPVEWHEGAAVGVVLASAGYPASSSKGDVITGLDRAAALDGVELFHAATARDDGDLVTSGGRVLTVTGLGDSFAQARERAYAGVAAITFDGAQHRSDIALRAEQREAQSAGNR